jgi:hypothetical protein
LPDRPVGETHLVAAGKLTPAQAQCAHRKRRLVRAFELDEPRLPGGLRPGFAAVRVVKELFWGHGPLNGEKVSFSTRGFMFALQAWFLRML